MESNVDKVERLMLKRYIPFKFAGGGVELFLGIGIDDMLAGWYRSAIFNFCAGFLILVG